MRLLNGPSAANNNKTNMNKSTIKIEHVKVEMTQ